MCAASARVWQAWPELLGGRARFVSTAVDQLKCAKDEGVDTVIDVTTFDLGRESGFWLTASAAVAEASGCP